MPQVAMVTMEDRSQLLTGAIELARNVALQNGSDPVQMNDLRRLLDGLNLRTTGTITGNPDELAMELLNMDSPLMMALWFLPAGSKLHLHNHPGMNVFFKPLAGTCDYRSFTLLEPFVRPARPIRAVEHLMTSLDGDAPTLCIGPQEGNVHSIKALTGFWFLDVIFPPYNETRECTYYRAVPNSAHHGSLNQFFTLHPTEECQLDAEEAQSSPSLGGRAAAV
eukprot:NODE_1432_length_1531_cov_55.778003_g1293_i0.p1 GENE.NODE_1432_length_1531_cov_55.778003_g1293_i0~~NODE_1432_length_1531_cov_55.778003_g1293_i0.p1  ORF type:complete len:222 (-),score=18.28 NODE_1432_length_1531_cov_55.778003_g1293_i0:673-1338(-)